MREERTRKFGGDWRAMSVRGRSVRPVKWKSDKEGLGVGSGTVVTYFRKG